MPIFLPEYICSRVYRAPELVMGCESYTEKIDVWSAGCVMMEMLLMRPLFPARNNENLLTHMERLLGDLDEKEKWKLKDGVITGEPAMVKKKYSLERLVKNSATVTHELIDLLHKIFQWDPQLRISSKDAINHSYFKSSSSQVVLSMNDFKF